jgi:hypothetical protein
MVAKTDKPEPEQDRDEGPDPASLMMGLSMAQGAPALSTAEGVAAVFCATQDFVSENLKPEVVFVEDPDTGIAALGVATAGRLVPLGADFFDGARENPRFRRGTAALTRVESFIAHVNRFGDADSVVFADDNRTAPKLTAVLDYHRADSESELVDNPGREHGEYRHGKHRTTFAFPLSDEWKAWQKANATVMSMGDFATFLEDRLADIAGAGDDYPEHVERLVAESGGPERIATYASLMELARGLHVYGNAQVEEAVNLASGEGNIRFSVEHETRTRTGGTVKVPRLFFIAIPVFAKGAFYRIAARLRYRKTPEGVKFWFELYRADLSFDHAFAEVVAKVDDQTNATVLYGSPEA